MKKSRLLGAVCAGASFLLCLTNIYAASVPAVHTWNFAGGASVGTSGSFGFSFVPTTDLVVTALGVSTLNGLKDVGLWGPETTGPSLATTTITSSDIVIDDYRYSSISPVGLSAGIEYTVAVFLVPGDRVGGDQTPYTSIPEITTVLSRVAVGVTALVRPNGHFSSSHGIYVGPNLLVESVPIPPALWLFGSGLLGLVGVARKKAAQ